MVVAEQGHCCLTYWSGQGHWPEAGFGSVVVVAERSEQGDLGLQAANSADLGQGFEVAEVGFLLIVTLTEVLKVAAWLVGWVCCSGEESVSHFLERKSRLGGHHPPY